MDGGQAYYRPMRGQGLKKDNKNGSKADLTPALFVVTGQMIGSLEKNF